MSRTYRKAADEARCENEADEKELLKHLKRKDRKHGITIVTDGNAHGGIRDKFDDYVEQPGKKRVLKKQKVKKERAEGNDIIATETDDK